MGSSVSHYETHTLNLKNTSEHFRSFVRKEEQAIAAKGAVPLNLKTGKNHIITAMEKRKYWMTCCTARMPSLSITGCVSLFKKWQSIPYVYLPLARALRDKEHTLGWKC